MDTNDFIGKGITIILIILFIVGMLGIILVAAEMREARVICREHNYEGVVSFSIFDNIKCEVYNPKTSPMRWREK